MASQHNPKAGEQVTARLQKYDEVIGQDEAVTRLKAFSDFHLRNGSPAGHVLILGEEGTGRMTIARVLAHELGIPFVETDASSLQIKGDLTASLTNLRPREAIIVREVHRLRRQVLESFTPALRTHRLEIVLGSGPGARTHVMDLKSFTLIATATSKSECPSDLLSCFSLVVRLEAYSVEALTEIAKRVAGDTGVEIDSECARLLAANSGGRPHQTELLMGRVRTALGRTRMTSDDVRQAFSAFGINVRSDGGAVAVPEITQMSGVEFEKLIATLLARMEFVAEMTKTTGDGGIDIIATLSRPIVGGKYLFQCKRYAPDNLVGVSTVRDFYGAVTADRAAKGILITTSDFTPQAREFGERVGLELISLGGLGQLLKEYGIDRLRA